MFKLLKNNLLISVLLVSLVLSIHRVQPAAAVNNPAQKKDINSAEVEKYLEKGRKYLKELERYKNLFEGRAAAFVDKNLLEYINTYYGPGATNNLEYDREESLLRLIDFSKYAKKEYEKAVISFTEAIKLDPGNKEALHSLALLAMDANEYDKFLDYQKQIIENYPDDKNAHLFSGYGYHKQNNNEQAYREYEKAKSLMDPEEKAVFERVDYIVPADTVEEYKILSLTDKKEFNKEFWRMKDPLFLSEYNERKLEHYSRVAYSNLKFGYEKKELPGWQTDRGMIYIRCTDT